MLFSYRGVSVGSDAPPNSMLSLVHHSEEHLTPSLVHHSDEHLTPSPLTPSSGDHADVSLFHRILYKTVKIQPPASLPQACFVFYK